MEKRFRPPIRLLVIAALLLVAGLIARPIVAGLPQMSTAASVLVTGIPFLLIFVAILLTYIAIIVTVSRYYSGYLPESKFNPVFYTAMGGIVMGVVLLFQPLSRVLFTIGFILLLLSLLFFMIVGHILPKKELTND